MNENTLKRAKEIDRELNDIKNIIERLNSGGFINDRYELELTTNCTNKNVPVSADLKRVIIALTLSDFSSRKEALEKELEEL